MKKKITILVLSLLGISLMPGCKKSFLNRPPLGAPTSGTFYQSDAEILEGTGPLYNGSWGGYNGTSLQYIGDVMGGNSTTDNYQGRGAYLNFAVSSTDPSGALQSRRVQNAAHLDDPVSRLDAHVAGVTDSTPGLPIQNRKEQRIV